MLVLKLAPASNYMLVTAVAAPARTCKLVRCPACKAGRDRPAHAERCGRLAKLFIPVRVIRRRPMRAISILRPRS